MKIRNFFKKPEVVIKTKSADGERLTAWEKLFLWKQLQKDGTVICPNCESARMYQGPQGGMSVNIRCPKCGQGVNFLWLPGCTEVDALDWCDNIGIDKSYIFPDAETIALEKVQPEELLSDAEKFSIWVEEKFNSFVNWLKS